MNLILLVNLLRGQTLQFNASTELELSECLVDDDDNTQQDNDGFDEKDDEAKIAEHQIGEMINFEELVHVSDDDGESEDCPETTQQIVDEKSKSSAEYVQEIRIGRKRISKLN